MYIYVETQLCIHTYFFLIYVETEREGERGRENEYTYTNKTNICLDIAVRVQKRFPVVDLLLHSSLGPNVVFEL